MNYRRTLTRLVTFLGGLYFFLEFVLPQKIFGIDTALYDEDISNGLITVSAMALGLGIFNILAIHGSKIVFRRKGFGNSIALLIGLGMMLSVTYMDWRSGVRTAGDVDRMFVLRDFANRIKSDYETKAPNVPPVHERNRKLSEAALPLIDSAESADVRLQTPPDATAADKDLFASLTLARSQKSAAAREAVGKLDLTDPNPADLSADEAAGRALGDLGSTRLELLNLVYKYSVKKKMYDFLYSGLFVSLGAAMFSLLGFYIASAAYRAFRVKSGESALMMVAAFMVMLGQIPFGLWIWSGFPEVRLWLLSVPSAAAFRAIKIGAGVASLVMAYRMWFSIESEEFSRSES